MLQTVQLLDSMDEQMWVLLQRNLKGITEEEADWRPHPTANPVRWIVGHLAWYEEWARDALHQDGRFLIDRNPNAYLEGTLPAMMERFGSARSGYRERIAALADADLSRPLNYFGQYDITVLDLLKTHALHLAGHRFQVRYVRGSHARAFGLNKAEFDPW